MPCFFSSTYPTHHTTKIPTELFLPPHSPVWGGTAQSTIAPVFAESKRTVALPGITTSMALFGALLLNTEINYPGHQLGLQYCKKCFGLGFSPGSSQMCQAGGPHDYTNSWTFKIPNHTTTQANAQHGWRWCNECQGLTFVARSKIGRCPAGGEHDHIGSREHSILQNLSSVPSLTQNNWRWCSKCQVMEWNGILL